MLASWNPDSRERLAPSMACFHDAPRQAGYSDRQIQLAVERGDWVKCTSAVFLVAGTPSPFLANAWVAVLAAGKGAMLSHRVAGQLHKLDGVPTRTVLDIYVPAARRPRDVPRARLHRVDVGPPVRCLGLPATALPLTVVDLARELPAGTGTRIVADALRTGRVSLEALEHELTVSAMRNHIERARQAVLLADPRLESILEDELFRIVRHVNIEIIPQYEIFAGGQFVARVDFGIPKLRLALEADGYATHALRPGFERDREKAALLQLAGWTALSFTASQIRRRPNWVHDVVCRRVEQRRNELGLESR
jgi:very-short-patch-repair endonuclease